MGRRLGQHFLKDPRLLSKIAQIIRPEDKILVEIGAGVGYLSQYLLSAKKLYLIELDENLCAVLQEKFSGYENVDIICGDILKFDLNLVSGYPDSINVCGNIPYYITTRIIEKLVENAELISDAVLLVQREYAERLCAEPGIKKYGSITIFTNLFYTVKKRGSIAGAAFTPKARVDTNIIQFLKERSKSEIKNFPEFSVFLKGLFSGRRKKIRNSLKRIGLISAYTMFDDMRIEQLSVSEVIKLYKEVVKR